MISQTEASPLSPQYSLGESDSNAANDQNEKKSPRLLTVTKPSSSLSFSSPDSEEIVSSDDHLSDDDQEIAEIVRFLKDLDQKEKEERQHHRKSCDASKSSLNYSEASTEGSPHAGRGILEGTTLTDNSTVGEHSSLSGESWTTASRSDGPKHAMPDGDAPIEEIEEEEESNPSSTTPTKGNLRTTTYVDDTIHDASNLLIPPFVLRPRTSYDSCSDYSSNSVSTPVPSRPTFLCNNSLEEEEEKDESPLKFHHCRKTEFTGSPKRRSHQNVVHDIVDDVPVTSLSAVVIHTEYGDIAPEKEEPKQAASTSQEYSSSSSSRWICGLDLEDWTNAQSDLRLYFCF